MTIHCVRRDTLRATGETPEQWFRRIAREKPHPDPNKLCRACHQDHRGPVEYWPAGEWSRHHQAECELEGQIEEAAQWRAIRARGEE